MTNIESINIMTEYLFRCDFFSDEFDPEGKEEHLDKAYDLLEAYPWKDILTSWNAFLHTNCKTPEAVINFCNLFYYYGGTDQFIPEPYSFLGYIFSIVDWDQFWDTAGDFLDSFCISILEKAGEISLMKDPYYQPWKDPKLQQAVEEHKKRNSK